ncbi:MAG: TolC family outer membrane protein [Henriciella sp.]
MRHRSLMAAMAAFALSGTASAETLADAIQTAYLNNPQLEAQRKQTANAEEQLAQAKSQRKPQISANASYGYESVESTRPFSTNLGDRPVSTAQLQASLPLYTGGRIKAGINQARAGIGIANAQLEGASQDLILQVITAYVDVLRDRETVSIRENSVELLREQVRASRDRFEVGEVTRTDVAQSEARLEGARAGLAGAEAQLEGTLALYFFLVGADAGDLVPAPIAPLLPPTIEEAMEVAFERSPDIQASVFNERAASEGVKVAYGALKPSISLVTSATQQETYENGFRDTNVSATAQATIPLFQGGLVRSQVRSAKLQRDQARLRTDNVERQIRAQVAQAWYGHVASLKSIEASERQVEAAEIAYEGAKEELAVGVRTTLDVLDQEQQLLDARLTLIRSERDAYVAVHQLLRSMGSLDLQRLNLSVQVYDPGEYGDKVKRNWLLTDTE